MGQTKSRKKGFSKKGLIEIEKQITGCDLCGLNKTNIITPNMPVSGNGRLNALIIGEAPGGTDDIEGKQFCGDSGAILERAIQNAGFKMRRDFWIDTIVKCRPTEKSKTGLKNRAPKQIESKYCFQKTVDWIKINKPRFIILVGDVAVEAFYGDFFSKEMSLWRGQIIPDRQYNAFVLPIYDPSLILKNEKDINLKCTFERDVQNACNFIFNNQKQDISDYWVDLKTEQVLLIDEQDILRELRSILRGKPELISIDYETNMLRPYHKKARILTVSICDGKKSIAFPLMHKNHKYNPVILNTFIRILESDIPKTAHNLKFEEEWSRVRLGVHVNNWLIDTILVAHIFDNRRESTSLDFQTLLNFGRLPYSEHVEKHKKAKKDDIENALETVDIVLLLNYNCLDTIYNFHLAKKQLCDNRYTLFKAPIKLFLEGTLAFCDLQENGIQTDQQHFTMVKKEFERKIKRYEKRLKESQEAFLFKEKMGRDILWTSGKDLGTLYFDILQNTGEKTSKGNYKTDRTTLEALDIPINRVLLKKKKYEKALSTYIAPFIEFPIDGILHPSFDLNIPISYRSSSSGPNFQNIPVRDKEIQKFVRKGLIARKGNVMLEADFKSFEVSMSATFHKDPQMIKYLTDKGTDMHRDVACDLLKMPVDSLIQEKRYKDLRFHAKNSWTFAQFYGSWYFNCGTQYWNNVSEYVLNDGRTVKQYFTEEHGINNLDMFLEHCKEVERIFWKERFKVYDKWRWDLVRFYQKYGYVENHFGFRFTGYMERNKLCNYGIQSCAFHCLLWTLIQVNKEMKRLKLKSKFIGQIHDSMLFDVFPPELQQLKEVITYYGMQRIREKFKWIVVPLEIEFAETPVNGSWYDKKDVA